MPARWCRLAATFVSIPPEMVVGFLIRDKFLANDQSGSKG